MRLYETIDEVRSEIKRDLKELAVVYQSPSVQDMDTSEDEGYETHELMGYTYSVPWVNPHDETNWSEDINWGYIHEEFTERVSNLGLNPGESWKWDGEYWSQFLHDGQFSYTYSERMQGQLDQIITVLGNNQDSRQAWLPIWEPVDIYRAGNMRVPCSLGYHFMVRRGQLHIHYVMRSCDFVKHWEKDIILALMLQEWVGYGLGIDRHNLGLFTHTTFSMHAFAKDLEGVF